VLGIDWLAPYRTVHLIGGHLCQLLLILGRLRLELLVAALAAEVDPLALVFGENFGIDDASHDRAFHLDRLRENLFVESREIRLRRVLELLVATLTAEVDLASFVFDKRILVDRIAHDGTGSLSSFTQAGRLAAMVVAVMLVAFIGWRRRRLVLLGRMTVRVV